MQDLASLRLIYKTEVTLTHLTGPPPRMPCCSINTICIFAGLLLLGTQTALERFYACLDASSVACPLDFLDLGAADVEDGHPRRDWAQEKSFVVGGIAHPTVAQQWGRTDEKPAVGFSLHHLGLSSQT